MFRPTTILHPTDFSDYSRHAFQIALDLAKEYGASLLILHVVETLGPENLTFGEVSGQLEPEAYRERLRTDLQRVAPPAGSSVRFVHLLAEGDPTAEITRAAKEHACGLIVMGTHGRTGLRRLLMGSVAEQVIRHAESPVLTVKSRAPD
ncbi:MAG: universal stress protein [Planctomycetes bacterium]|nr:universal stress protein [Planctomycetota bacterium]